MTSSIVGLDSILFSRTLIESPDKLFKALMTVAVTIEDENEFRKAYDESMTKIFKKEEMDRKKRIYKGYHFCLQAKDKSSEMMFNLVEELADYISRIDLYCGYYNVDDISIFGDAAGQRIKRFTFLKKYQHGFHHVCTWKYANDYGSACKFKLDHFQGHHTPAWADLTKNNDKDIEIYYSGSECEPSIALSDIILKLIQLHQHGIITSQTMCDVISRRCPSFGTTSRKLAYHAMGAYLRETTPVSTLEMNLDKYVKHPVYFILWSSQSPSTPKERIKSMFEWSPAYNAIANRVYEENGCIKNFATERDHMLWDAKRDKLVAWSQPEEEMVNLMTEMGFETPQVLKRKDFA